jgi:hypothetical protein
MFTRTMDRPPYAVAEETERHEPLSHAGRRETAN